MAKTTIVYIALVIIGILLDELVRKTGIKMVVLRFKKGQSKKEAVAELIGNKTIEVLRLINVISRDTHMNPVVMALGSAVAMISAVDDDLGEEVKKCIEDYKERA